MSLESVSEALAAIFMRWCMAAQIATVTARITAFCTNGGPCKLSSGKSRGLRMPPAIFAFSKLSKSNKDFTCKIKNVVNKNRKCSKNNKLSKGRERQNDKEREGPWVAMI